MELDKRFLVVQNSPKLGAVDENTAVVYSLIKNNICDAVDFVVLPELWNVGWCPSIFQANAEELDNSKTVSFLKNLAKEFNVNVFGGSFVSKQNGQFYNTCPIINRNAELVAVYNKIHLFGYDDFCEDEYLSHGENAVLVELEGIKFGVSICYDIRFPDLFRVLSTNGAQVFVNMAAWPKSRLNHWVTLQKARAIENQAFVLACTQTGVIENDLCNLGHSLVVNPMGEILVESDDSVQCFDMCINVNEVDDIRKVRSIISDIKPNCYGIRKY